MLAVFGNRNHNSAGAAGPTGSAMTDSIRFDAEDRSNTIRESIARTEPKALRTFTPSQAVLAKSAGCFHWTPEGRRLYDFTSGVLVANLGHAQTTFAQILRMQAGDVIAFDIPEVIEAAVDGVPVMECRYGVSNGQYALKVEKIVGSADSSILEHGDQHA